MIGRPSVVQNLLIYETVVLAETHSCSSQIRGSSSACDPICEAWPNSNSIRPPSFILHWLHALSYTPCLQLKSALSTPP